MKRTLLAIFLICCASAVHGLPATPELCVVSSLETPYFTPLLDTPRKARGCSTLSTNPIKKFFERLDTSNQSQSVRPRDVHVIFLHTFGNPSLDLQTIKLNIVVVPQRANETKLQALNRLDLVLHSDRPVKWMLRANFDDEDENDDDYMAAQPKVWVTEGSRIESNFNANVSHRRWSNRKALQRYIQNTFTGIASYSEVRGANHVELRIGTPSVGFVQCDMHANEESAVVTASLMVQLETEGCFHEDYIGDHSMDVYVVELGGTKGRNKRVGPNSLLPVMVQLLGEGTRPVPRNVTVVLKSHQPIRWQFGARRINGNIIVVSDREDQVENSSADGTEQLEVRSKSLPDNVVELLLSVTSEFGPPILYAKTPHASTLRLLVGSKNKSGVRSGPEQAVSHVLSDHSSPEKHRKEHVSSRDFYPRSKIPIQESKLDPVSQLKAAMVVHCGKTLINVSFPSDLMEALGSPKLSLSDSSCRAKYNGTHATISSHITSCGNTGTSDGKFTLFTNDVNVKFIQPVSDDEDFEASGDVMAEDGKITVMCQVPPQVPGDPRPPGGIMVESPRSEHNTPSLYLMEMFRGAHPNSRIMFDARDPPEAELGETLFVMAFLEAAVPVQVVTEECWVSNMSNHRHPAAAMLLVNTCPVDSNTRIEPAISMPDRPPHGAFSFRVDKSYLALGQIYLHCRLGLCALDKERTKGNLKMCTDPLEYCSNPNRETRVSTAQQFNYRGPLKLVRRRHREPTSSPPPGSMDKKTAARTPAPPLPPSPPVATAPTSLPPPAGVVEPRGEDLHEAGISTEIAIVIAIASFAIGVCLTVSIWFIHNKTAVFHCASASDPFRRRDKQNAHVQPTANSGAMACNLSPNSGCSSTNSQAAIAT